MGIFNSIYIYELLVTIHLIMLPTRLRSMDSVQDFTQIYINLKLSNIFITFSDDLP